MKSSFKMLILLPYLLITANFSWAGHAQGLVSLIFVHEPNVLMFDVGPITNAPYCNSEDQWAIKMDTFLGKSMLAVLLSAQAQGKEVLVVGYSNTCTAWPDRELPSYMMLVD